MKVLILGGTRFLGKCIVETLVQHGHQVTSVNIDEQASQKLPRGVESVFCNRKDHHKLRQALAGHDFDVVLDIVSAPTLPEDVAAVLDATGHNLKRYVFCSSSTVYRKTGFYPMTEEHPLKRGAEDGASPYTQTKPGCERYLMDKFEREGLPVTIIRPRHIYGPENYTYREGFHFDRLTRGRPILIPGDGSWLNQLGYVDDLAESFRLAIESEAAIGQGYTITGAESVTLDVYIDLLGEVAGVKPQKVYFEPKLLERFDKPVMYFGEAESFDEGQACFSIDKARRDMGYEPRFSLPEGLKKTFEWYTQSGGDTFRRMLDFGVEDRLIGMARARAL